MHVVINMKDIHIFFNRLKLDDGAIWLEDETIRLSTSKKLQTEETRDFVINNKIQITAILKENKIFSKEKFLNVLIFKDNITAFYPLSSAQERLWFIEQYEQGSNAYHIPAVYELDSDTSLAGIKFAIQKIVSRHEVLRSTIEQLDNTEHGIQRVHDEPLIIEEIKLTGKQAYRSLIQEEINRPFDLSTEYPLRVKFYIVQSKKAPGIRSKQIFLLINIHHIATDGWSAEIFEKELHGWYKAFRNKDKSFSLPALEIQYKDYALWQRTFLTGPLLQKQLSYWKTKLSNFQALELPTDFARPNRVDYRGAYKKFTLNKEISRKLRALAKLNGATLHSVLLSSINILLNKYTGQNDIVIGSPIANRHHRETEGLIGFFVNMLVNRTRLNALQSYEELIKKVHREQVQAQLYQDLPFEKLVDELGVNRDISRHPVFQVMFAVQSFGNQPNRKKQKFSLKPSQAENFYEVEKFDLSFYMDDSHEELMGEVSYATALFHKDTIERLVRHYIYLLGQLTEAPQLPYSRYCLLSPEEYEQIVYDWNATGNGYANHKTICQLFQEQVGKTPGNIALVYEGRQLTYQQLNEKSNQLARHIRKQYLQRTKQALAPGTLIALYLDRSLEMVIGILGVLKAGGAYVPIDTNYPQKRINYLLEDTRAELIISQRQLTEHSRIQLPHDKVIYISLTADCYKEKNTLNLPQHSKASDLAYVIYTSGSTGNPKGVMIEQRSVTNLVNDLLKKYSIDSSERFLLFANYVFDASVEQMFLSLLSGGTLFVADGESINDSNRFENYITKHRITHLHSTPSFLSNIDPSKLPTLKRVVFGAEYLSKQLFDQYKAIIPTIINEYGPTETAITSLVSVNSYLLGNATIQNTKAYVLDPDLNPVPIGATGELYISGAGLARGYLNKKDLTEERFIGNPFATEADRAPGHTRLYKTGDLVRWLPGGNLVYIGRNDDQVKINGFRIEPGEIEYALSQIAGIRQCCVLAKERKTAPGGNKYLVAYYVLDNSGDSLSPTFITDKLSQALPGYMVPRILVKLESFPLTINGKLDKRALPDPGFSLSPGEYVAPTNEIEMDICKTWEKVLGLERVGITDNFFRIGGNSILAIQVSYRMSKALGFDIKVADLFRLKTIDRIVAAHDQYSGLVKPYHFIQNKSLDNMIFIHPGHGGSEVYQHLADLLSGNYNCIGIDNYNIHHKDKIGSLNKLAHHYLVAYEKKYAPGERVNLLGWSLGGQVALEIAAILEGRGFKNINVFLLDTFIRGEIMPGFDKQKNSEYPAKKNKVLIKYESSYFDKVAAAFDTEQELASSFISCGLQYTRVVLFKAIEREAYPGNSNKKSKYVVEHFKKLPANNIDLVTGKIAVINLNCNHGNILDTNSATISNYVLSNQAADKMKRKSRKSIH
ncbi:MAG: amino acid adenylation domain-containing protein [Ferruginibacter sp.]